MYIHNLKIQMKNFCGRDCNYIIEKNYTWQPDAYSGFVTNQSPHFWIPTKGDILSCVRETTNPFNPITAINP